MRILVLSLLLILSGCALTPLTTLTAKPPMVVLVYLCGQPIMVVAESGEPRRSLVAEASVVNRTVELQQRISAMINEPGAEVYRLDAEDMTNAPVCEYKPAWFPKPIRK